MGSNSNVNSPHLTSAELMVYRFINFFVRKTTVIGNEFISDSPTNTCNIYLLGYGYILCLMENLWNISTSFWIWSQGDCNHQVSEHVMWLGSTAHLVFEEFLPLITAIINKSGDESVMSLCLKRATTTLLLKRSGLDQEDMKNYRPISNLHFIIKLIEIIVTRRIEEHLEHNDLHDSYQSAWRRGYSIEIAPLKAHSCIAEALDEGSMTALIKFDLSPAYGETLSDDMVFISVYHRNSF